MRCLIRLQYYTFKYITLMFIQVKYSNIIKNFLSNETDSIKKTNIPKKDDNFKFSKYHPITLIFVISIVFKSFLISHFLKYHVISDHHNDIYKTRSSFTVSLISGHHLRNFRESCFVALNIKSWKLLIESHLQTSPFSFPLAFCSYFQLSLRVAVLLIADRPISLIFLHELQCSIGFVLFLSSSSLLSTTFNKLPY